MRHGGLAAAVVRRRRGAERDRWAQGGGIGLIRLPEICSSVCFGGSEMNQLFTTGNQSLYAVFVNTHGAHVLGA